MYNVHTLTPVPTICTMYIFSLLLLVESPINLTFSYKGESINAAQTIQHLTIPCTRVRIRITSNTRIIRFTRLCMMRYGNFFKFLHSRNIWHNKLVESNFFSYLSMHLSLNLHTVCVHFLYFNVLINNAGIQNEQLLVMFFLRQQHHKHL